MRINFIVYFIGFQTDVGEAYYISPVLHESLEPTYTDALCPIKFPESEEGKHLHLHLAHLCIP